MSDVVKRRYRYFGWLVLGFLVFACIVISPRIYAKTPDFAQIVELSGKRLLFRKSSGRLEDARQGQRLRNHNQALVVPGNNNSWANLVLINQDNGNVGMTVKAGPDLSKTEYKFPCTFKCGIVTIGWWRGNNRGCETEGVHVKPCVGNRAKLPKSKKVLIAQANSDIPIGNSENSELESNQEQNREIPADEIFFKLHDSESTIVQINESDLSITNSTPSNDIPIEKTEEAINTNVSVLLGSIEVSSTQYPQGQLLQAGERYTYEGDGKGKIDDININKKTSSSKFKDFVDPYQWLSSDKLNKKTKQDIREQLTSHRSALGLSVAAWLYPPEAGAECACLYPQKSELRDGQKQGIVYGIWELRSFFYIGEVRERFSCNVNADQLPQGLGKISLEEQNCQRPDLKKS